MPFFVAHKMVFFCLVVFATVNVQQLYKGYRHEFSKPSTVTTSKHKTRMFIDSFNFVWTYQFRNIELTEFYTTNFYI